MAKTLLTLNRHTGKSEEESPAVMTLFDLSSGEPYEKSLKSIQGFEPEERDEFPEPIESQVNTKTYIHEHSLDSTEQLVKIPRNHRRITYNPQTTWKRQVLACCNLWSGKSNS